jgi:CubicO group peptidase (beta-lactamase class C family)
VLAENSCDCRREQWKRAPLFPSGGGGLASTIDDYLAFAHMLLNKGERSHSAAVPDDVPLRDWRGTRPNFKLRIQAQMQGSEYEG